MTRKNWLDIHLYLSSFFMPFIILFTVTGTLYLIGEKGSEDKKLIKELSIVLEKDIEKLQVQIPQILKEQNIKTDYEYLKVKGNKIYLRPTSRDYFYFERAEHSTRLYISDPSIQKAFMELHKGHGPKVFKNISIVFGVGLFLISLSGMILGLMNRALRKKIWPSFIVGTSFMLIILLVFNL